MFDFCADFFLMLASWISWISLDICEILMNICNETWIVWEGVIWIDMRDLCVCVCVRHVCVYSK